MNSKVRFVGFQNKLLLRLVSCTLLFIAYYKQYKFGIVVVFSFFRPYLEDHSEADNKLQCWCGHSDHLWRDLHNASSPRWVIMPASIAT